MKNNVLIVAVLSSTIFPCIKFNKPVEKKYKEICQEDLFITSQIFSEKFSNEGTKNFTTNIIKFFKELNDIKILGITTTSSDQHGRKL